MNLNKVLFYGNPYLGIYARANDKFALVPKNSPEKFITTIEETLQVKTIHGKIDASNLLGIYSVMNNNGIIVPDLISKEELKIIENLGINVHVTESRFTAIGNNVAVNDKGGIINKNIPQDEIKKMEQALGIELVPMHLDEYETVGSMCAVTNKGFIAHNELEPEVIKILEDIFKVKGLNGTANMGSPFVGISVIANSNGAVTGLQSSGVELQRIAEALDLI